jgi:hypothetical protein
MASRKQPRRASLQAAKQQHLDVSPLEPAYIIPAGSVPPAKVFVPVWWQTGATAVVDATPLPSGQFALSQSQAVIHPDGHAPSSTQTQSTAAHVGSHVTASEAFNKIGGYMLIAVAARLVPQVCVSHVSVSCLSSQPDVHAAAPTLSARI